MHFSHLQYLPLTFPFFSALAGILALLVLLVQLGALGHAYTRLGMSGWSAMLLLVASLAGSYFNIPVAALPQEQVLSGQEIVFYGMHYMVPIVTEWPGTIVAVNVGGAVIPCVISLYLLAKLRLWGKGLVTATGVAVACHLLARPIIGLGIALPIFVPAIVTAFLALLLSRRYAAPLAYIGGSLGVLVGADLLNLDKIQGLGAPVASIGGAGTFDGIFLTGVLAVLIASVSEGTSRIAFRRRLQRPELR
jgi:uncharacterized membrane protein